MSLSLKNSNLLLSSCSILGYAPKKTVFANELAKEKKILLVQEKNPVGSLVWGKTLMNSLNSEFDS
jgi:hypothetical protein